MAHETSDGPDVEASFTVADIRDAAEAGAITQTDADNLIHWLSVHHSADETDAPRPEQDKGFNLVTVAYYFGAMIMISACGWFLGTKWETLGSGGVLVTALVYFAIAASLGWWLRGKGYIVGGGLLITVAVCLTPLIVYSVEDLLGYWPTDHPGKYEDYYPWINGSWIIMELATMAVALAALVRVRFGFLTAPLAFSLWFFSMDFAAWILGKNNLDWNSRAWISIMVGVVTILFGYALERTMHTKGEPRSQDFAFWCYLFGLMAFWGGMTAMDSNSEIGRVIYLVINIGLVGVSLYLRRSVFLVFGAVGVYIYLGHLAYEVFKDSFMFPFMLAFLGLSMIVATVLGQKYLRRQIHEF